MGHGYLGTNIVNLVITWGERFEKVSPPGVLLEEMAKLPGTPVIQDGCLVTSDAPGFGLEIDQAWINRVS